MKTKLICILGLLLATSNVFAYDFIINSIAYKITTSNTAYVTSGGNQIGALTIPNTVTYNSKVYIIDSIGSSSFRGNTLITAITLPSMLKSIGNYAFESCSSLTSINIPNSVTSIGNQAFYNCFGLTSINLPFVTSIGNRAFYNCFGLTSITLPSVTSIGDGAFEYCSGFTSIILPNSTINIGNSAFEHCSSLSSITIPNSVTNIGKNAFFYCSNLTNITVDNNNPNYCSLNGVLFNKTKTTLILYPIMRIGISYIIPNTVTNIVESAFEYSWNLKKIEVESDNSNYSSLDGVLFNKTQTSLIVYPSSRVDTSYTIPNSVKDIFDRAFYRTSNLKSINLPNSVTNIGKNAFSYCSNLTRINIPNSVLSIANQAFLYCSSFKSITLPNSVTSISDGTFEFCSSLTNISIPNSITSIGNRAFGNCSSLSSITLPNSVTSLGNQAFWYCNSLTSVTLPNSLPNIALQAFWYCSGLKSITIPASVTSIGNYAFGNCSDLTTITIPKSVSSIGDGAFYECSSLVEIYAKSITPINLAYPNIFWNVDKSKCKLYVPKGSKMAYLLAVQWTDFQNIVEENVSTGKVIVKPNELGMVVKKHQLVFSSLPINESVIVLDLAGKVIFYEMASSESMSVNLPNSGVFIVGVGNKFTKIFN